MGVSAARVVTWIVAFVVGAVYGVAGTIGQAAAWGVLPVGLIVAIAGVAALLVAMRVLSGRGSALAAGLGVMGATLLFSGRGPGGSIVVPAAAEGALSTGLVWTVALPVVVAVVVAWPAAARRTATN
ncbi:histidinol dehydrogenase [Microbacterium sp.]|uniref:histidinol dehydrogenase n=1 Tax=Microbacterium sp. TaxID=51671 RepID=UPI0032215B79